MIDAAPITQLIIPECIRLRLMFEKPPRRPLERSPAWQARVGNGIESIHENPARL
jgi:hypothetical protein